MLGYDKKGQCKGTIEETVLLPTILKWNLHMDCKVQIQKCVEIAQRSAEDLQLNVLVFEDFGKNLIKKINISPDGFIQMAFQLAYFRDQKQFSLTYEASMTRLFREGRTETIRSCTSQSCDWVRSMDNSSKTVSNQVFPR